MALTSAQIITRVCAICKAPGFITQAGQYLNSNLDDLCQTYDFDYIRKVYSFPVSSASAVYPMPTNYLRARFCYYNVNGTIFWVDQIPYEKYLTLFQGPGVSNYPYNFATDISATPANLYFYPPPAVSVTMNVGYQPRMTDITTPETSSAIPWFLDQRYLITKISADLMQETDDDRADRFHARAAEMLRNILSMDDDKEGYARTVKLDPSTFKNNNSNRPTKQQPL